MRGYRSVSARVYALRRGARYKELKMRETPILQASSSAGIHTSFSGRFAHDADIDYINDELEPVLIIDGVEHRLGIFVAGTVTREVTATGDSDYVEAYDRGLLLQQIKSESRTHFDAGTLYTDVITDLLYSAGVLIDHINASTLTLSAAREDWEIGTGLNDIINDLLGEIGYNPIYFNADGLACVSQRVAADAAHITQRYGAGDYSMLSRDIQSTCDAYSAPNVFVAVVSNPDLGAPMTATAVNDNLGSALSVSRRGRRIVKTIQVDSIASQAALQDYVDEICRKGMYSTEQVEFVTALNPAHTLFDVVALSGDKISGIYAETGWEMSLEAGGSMRHTAERVIYSD